MRAPEDPRISAVHGGEYVNDAQQVLVDTVLLRIAVQRHRLIQQQEAGKLRRTEA